DALHQADQPLVLVRVGGREADPAVAHHHGRDPVPARRGDLRIPGHLRVVVGVDVDEAGRDQLAARVDLLAAGREIGIDGDDLAVTDPDVGATPGGAGSVDHRAAANHDIEARAVHRRHANTVFAGASGG